MQKAIALLSGGIDSPVSIHLLQDKLDIIAVHFHQLPLTDKKEVEKVKELVKKLGVRKVYLIPFTELLTALVKECKHDDYFVLQKISMFKTAEMVAEKEGAKFLITGENLAQVSSQTLSNMTTITQNLKLEILRPVLTYDKKEIIKVAEKIGTYEISKGPEICCLLGPKHPSTKSDYSKIKWQLDQLEFEKIVKGCLDKAEIITA
ncbi:MAG: 7-cyano-7-deazaguanine synthase [Candidatus Woesearchaeota archaeon]|jgi:thiamine biosynthesis protein ThiI